MSDRIYQSVSERPASNTSSVNDEFARARTEEARSRKGGVASSDEPSQRIADHAVSALLAELSTWPKPGLVSYVDNGSHRDMDAALLAASAHCLHPFFKALAEAGQRNADMDELRAIGIRAEEQMLTVTRGINTHRGAIFGLGLLCAAAGLNGRFFASMSLGQRVAERWGAAIMDGPLPAHSHGVNALRRYGAGGARCEAAAGFPSVYQLGLPALQEGLCLRPYAYGAASVHACMALIARVEDTNLLHRGGQEGACFAMQCASAFMSSGGIALEDWEARATAIHREFVARNLSPGGCADLLAMTLFVAMVEQG